ncbi:MFS family permease [Crossiella equi]|uniref:MFS family permease n=1 Tax=Crossiella equi TaxID=130796 RepID=A0ABS5A496_9PSEU|nr:MFS transporter [Crossiella equi]MBP2471397.1 MFS family permease [Crossiella equi]
MSRGLAVAGLYAGGFLGPFGGGVVTAMLPELGTAFQVSAQTASASVTVYMVPFAGLMLFSGTWGQRWGARRTVISAYLVYVAASLLCALAQDEYSFLAGRALQGAANAFTTPLLLGAVAAVTPPRRLGRALGWFASMQAAGQTSAPLLGGLAAELSWRYAFVGVAVVAAGLALLGLPGGGTGPRGAASLRSAWRPAVLRAGVVAGIGWGCLGGLSYLVAFRLAEDFALSAGERGLVLTGFGLTGILTARAIGRAVDRFGARRCVLTGTTVGAVLLAGVGLAPALWAVGLLWALAGPAMQLVMVGLNALVLAGNGANRSGAVSVVQSLRFGGGALSPVAFVPVHHLDPLVAFLLPAALLIASAPVVLPASVADDE